MYFGGINGFNAFYPDQILKPSTLFPVVITGIQVYNKPLAIAKNSQDPSPLKQDIADTRSITLSYKQSMVSLEFGSLDYNSANKKEYAYVNWKILIQNGSIEAVETPPHTQIFRLESMYS